MKGKNKFLMVIIAVIISVAIMIPNACGSASLIANSDDFASVQSMDDAFSNDSALANDEQIQQLNDTAFSSSEKLLSNAVGDNSIDEPSLLSSDTPATTTGAHSDCVGGHTVWTEITFTGGELTAGNYYLSGDVTLTANLTIPEGTTEAPTVVNLCLNGYKLTGINNGSVITISAKAILNLYDCQGVNGTNSIPRTHTYKKDATTGRYDFTQSGTGTISGGVITGGSASNGGGVYNNGTFNMHGGTIAGNKATNGGGVYNNGTFNMDGGTISGNTAISGGGVYNNYNKFNMHGGTISGNTATGAGINESNGGGVYNNVGTLTMSGGTISGNTAQTYGGGVYNHGTFTMSGGTIGGTNATSDKNTADYGGGVYSNDGNFTMENNAVISNNTAKNGGGVRIKGGSLSIKNNAVISNNTATSNGGGVCNDGVFNLSGGTISNNTAKYNGAGVYIEIDNGFFEISGTPKVTGNTVTNGTEVTSDDTANNVYLPKNKYLNVTDILLKGVDVTTDYAQIGVTLAGDYGSGAFTTDYGKNNTNVSPDKIFTMDNGKAVELSGGNVRVVPLHTHAGDTSITFDKILKDSDGELTEGNYVLNGDVKLTTNNLTIPTGTVNLCLNGYKLTGINNGSVITISAKAILNLYDCQGVNGTNSIPRTHTYVKDATTGRYDFAAGATGEAGSISGGVITGGSAENGGGVYNLGKFNMFGGTIAGNTATKYGGGGIQNNGTFTMSGGAIAGNTAINCNGGGVYNTSTFTMNGTAEISGNNATSGGGLYNKGTCNLSGNASISNNTATSNGGGVNNTGEFNLSGGTISNNTATSGGGGVYNNDTFEMSGGTISNNTATTYYGGGVYNTGSNGTFKMNGNASISNNTAISSGGGVYNSATFEMSGGTISNNTATSFGGGVYNAGTFTMSGGTISNNTATTYYGGGVYNLSTFNLSGNANITGNVKGGNVADEKLTGGTANNVYLFKDTKITAGKFTVGSTPNIGVSLAYDYGDVVFTTDFGKFNSTVTDPNTIFTMDDINYAVSLDSTKKEVIATTSTPTHTHNSITFTEWTDSTSLPTTAGSYYLSANVTISNTWIVPTGTSNLCLNGKTITMTGGNSVIKIAQNVSLTIFDEAENAGKITGGKAVNSSTRGGGINNEGTLIFNGGHITGNLAMKGGGIYNAVTGKLTINGGLITGNASKYDNNLTTQGGGIYNEGTLTINDGQFTGNSATYGGDISNEGTATINGGQFTGNSASDSAISNGSVKDGKLTINGGVFKNAVPDKLRTMISSSMGSTLKITGGTFDNKDNKFDVYANTFNASFSNNVLLSVFVTYPIQIDGKLLYGSGLTITYNEDYKKQAPIWEIAKGKDYTITAEDFAKFSITNSKLFLRHDSVTPNGRILVILGDITIPTNSLGVTTLSIGGQNVTSASKGEKVKIITTPDSGKELDKIEVLKDDGDFTTKVTVDENNEFTMPEYKVIVSVTYKNSEVKPDDGTDYIKDVSSKTFKIKTERGLEKFTQEVNAGDNFENWTVTLENNIVLTKENSTQIGTDSTVFKGIFDGKKNTISNLQIDNASSDYQGLFRALAQGGTIKNLGIVNSTIKGKDNVGAIVAYNSGRVENCYSNGAVSGTNYVGGIVGYNYDGLIVDSCNEGIITGTNDSVGGIVGYHKKTAVNDSIIINCYNKGKITGYSNVGGIVGTKTTTNITLDTYDLGNCFNNAVVTGVENVGGIAGSSALRIGNCYNSGNVTGAVLTSGTNTAGGLVGELESGSFNMIVNSYYLQTETVNKDLDPAGVVIDGNVHNKVRNCSTFGKDKKLVTAGTQGAEKEDAWWVLTDFTKGADLTATLNVGVGVILDNKDMILPTEYTVTTWKDTSENPKLDLKDTPNGGGTPPSGNTSGGSGMTITNYDIFWKGIDTQVRLTNTDPVVAENSTTNYTVPKYVLDNHKATNKTLTIKFAEGDITITKEMAGKVSYSQESYTYAELKALFAQMPVVTPNPTPTPTPVPTEPEVVRNNLCWLWILLVILAIGGVITIYLILKKKSEKDSDEEQNNSEENK